MNKGIELIVGNHDIQGMDELATVMTNILNCKHATQETKQEVFELLQFIADKLEKKIVYIKTVDGRPEISIHYSEDAILKIIDIQEWSDILECAVTEVSNKIRHILGET